MEIELSVQADPAFQGKVDRERIRRVVLETLRREGTGKSLSLGLLITDDENIKRLNLRYRGTDLETDVLAFGMHDAEASFVTPPSVPAHLGDVVICYPRAEAQAEAFEQSVEEELDRLVVHGVLHLLGYEDRTAEERERMWERQEEILRGFVQHKWR